MTAGEGGGGESARERFEATKRTVTTLLPAIDGIEAEGYLSDLGDVLRAAGLIGVRVRKTSDPLRRYEAEARLEAPADRAAERLATACSRFAYPDEAHDLTVDADRVILEFVTWLPDRWQVSGRVVVSRA